MAICTAMIKSEKKVQMKLVKKNSESKTDIVRNQCKLQ